MSIKNGVWLVGVILLWSASLREASAGCRMTTDGKMTTFHETVADKAGTQVDTGKEIKVIEPNFFGFPLPGDPQRNVVTNGIYGFWKTITWESYKQAKKDCEGDQTSFPDYLENPVQNPASITSARRNATAGGPSVTTAAVSFDAADINGDKILDRFRISFQPAGFSVEIGRSNGTFMSPVRYATGPGAERFVLADFNGDRVFDVAVANTGNFNQDAGKVSILLGNADGTFRPAVHYTAGVAPRSTAVADFNGDGRLDLAVASSGSGGAPGLPANTGAVSVLRGNGDGTFQAATTLQAGQGPWSILAADFTGDQKLDLAVANRDSGTVSVLPGGGDGTFQPAVNTVVGTRPSYLGAADLNGDGALDLAVLHSITSVLSAWIGEGNGSFRSAGRYLAATSAASFAILESEDDLRPTILMSDSVSGDTFVFAANLAGTLVAPPVYPTGTNSQSLAAGDFDGDGRPDVVVSDQGGLSLLLGRGGAELQESRAIPITGAPGRGGILTAGDFNSDGRSDVAVMNSSGRISILTGTSGGFQSAGTLAAESDIVHLASLDVNADGRLDLAAVHQGKSDGKGALAVYLGDGNGTFAAPAKYTAGNFPRTLAAGDFNGDGRTDIAVVNHGVTTLTRGGISLFLADANGTLQPAINIDAGESPQSAAAADFNGDGRLDLAFVGIATSSPNYLFQVSVLPGNGNGAFQAPLHHPTDLSSGQLRAGDFDRDGRQDVIIALCCGSTDMMQLLGNGDGTFRESHYPNGGTATEFATADFDADGRLDLAVLNTSSGLPGFVAILQNSMWPMALVSAASNEVGNVAPESIVSAYGFRLADAVAGAPTPQWPTTLGGATVAVRDADGVERTAQIAFASPGQVNFLLPPGTASGLAKVTINSASGARTTPLGVQPVAPGIFVVNAQGLAAAVVVRVRASGEQVTEQVVQLSGGQIVPAPIDLGEETDQVLLVLFGTGIRGYSSLSAVKVTLGGMEGVVQYAGPQGEFPGLDQINVLVPRSLRGRGLVDVVVVADGSVANTVKIQFR